jgi:hypothetical protein
MIDIKDPRRVKALELKEMIENERRKLITK